MYIPVMAYIHVCTTFFNIIYIVNTKKFLSMYNCTYILYAYVPVPVYIHHNMMMYIHTLCIITHTLLYIIYIHTV